MLSFDSELSIDEGDPFFQQIQNSSRTTLKGHFSQLSGEAKRLVNLLSRLGEESDESASITKSDVEFHLYYPDLEVE
jgi:hypothetical protein